MNKILLIFSFIIFAKQTWSANPQLNFNIGIENPDTGQDRSTAATLVRFSIASKREVWRWWGAFTYATGTGYTQGEFTVGPAIYPFGSTSKMTFQPFFFLEAMLGFGTFDETARQDFGWGAGAGVDWLWTKSSGITISVAMQNATETSIRTWLGFFTTI